jgi:hypothetical protein
MTNSSSGDYESILNRAGVAELLIACLLFADLEGDAEWASQWIKARDSSNRFGIWPV